MPPLLPVPAMVKGVEWIFEIPIHVEGCSGFRPLVIKRGFSTSLRVNAVQEAKPNESRFSHSEPPLRDHPCRCDLEGEVQSVRIGFHSA